MQACMWITSINFVHVLVILLSERRDKFVIVYYVNLHTDWHFNSLVRQVSIILIPGYHFSHVMHCVIEEIVYIYIHDDTLLIFQQCYTRTGKQMILLTTVKCNFKVSHYQPLAHHAYYTCEWTSSFQYIYIAV